MAFGESSSEEDDDECEHCFGHVEKKRKNQQKKPSEENPDAHGPHVNPEPADISWFVYVKQTSAYCYMLNNSLNLIWGIICANRKYWSLYVRLEPTW